MRVIVCIKQVPVAAAMRFDRDQRRLKREGVPHEVNSGDIRAVVGTVAWARRRPSPTEIVLLTLGPPQARSALTDGLALGADRAVHLADPVFAGSDTLATARTLAAALKAVLEPFHLVVCARATTDSETGHVGAQLAELLRVQHVSEVLHVGTDATADALPAIHEQGGRKQRVRIVLPALISASEDFAPERYPTRAERESVDGSRIEVLSAADIRIDSEACGAAGSPTRVVAVREVAGSRDGRVVPPGPPDEQARQIVDWLMAHRLLVTRNSPADLAPSSLPSIPDAHGDPVWVYVDARAPTLKTVSLELLSKSRQLSDAFAGHVVAVIAGPAPDRLSRELTAHGADQVLVLPAPPLEFSTVRAYTAALARAVHEYGPRILLFPSAPTVRELAARLAARLDLGLTADCVDLTLGPSQRLVQHKPAFGDRVVALIESRTSPELATVRAGMFSQLTPNWERHVTVETLVPIADVPEVPTEVAGSAATAGVVPPSPFAADIAVGVGMGLGGPANLDAVYDLAELLDATVGCTRRVADEGWLPRHTQIGLTGLAIAPRLYVALGTRGAFEHMCGVRRSDLLLAINCDPDAPIFKDADLAVEGDLHSVLPTLVALLRSELPEVRPERVFQMR